MIQRPDSGSDGHPARTSRKDRERSRRTVLVVEDDRLLRWSVRAALRRDYRVRVAEDGEEALALLHRLPRIDALLTDIRLPGLDGFDLARQARILHPEIKIFIMTAFGDEDVMRRAFSARAEGYLAKPFELETLRDMLASHMAGAAPPVARNP